MIFVGYAGTCCNDGWAIGSLVRLIIASARGTGELLPSELEENNFSIEKKRRKRKTHCGVLC